MMLINVRMLTIVSELRMEFCITSGSGKVMSLCVCAVSSEHRFALCTWHCSGRVEDLR